MGHTRSSIKGRTLLTVRFSGSGHTVVWLVRDGSRGSKGGRMWGRGSRSEAGKERRGLRREDGTVEEGNGQEKEGSKVLLMIMGWPHHYHHL